MPDLTKEQRAELRKLATFTTKGAWTLGKMNRDGGRQIMGDREVCIVTTADLPQGTANARYIASANPQALLSLLDTLDRLEADAVAREAEVGRLRLAMAEAYADAWLGRKDGDTKNGVGESRPMLRLAKIERELLPVLESFPNVAASSQNIQPAQEGGKVKMGFTGTRNGMTAAQRTAVLMLLRDYEPAEVHHGDCVGADAQFADLAKSAIGARVVAHPGPDGDLRAHALCDEEWRPLTHFARNRNIVEQTDVLIATPPAMHELPSGGTWYTIRYARKVGKLNVVVWPDGTITLTPVRP
jgi:hypothetical protein